MKKELEQLFSLLFFIKKHTYFLKKKIIQKKTFLDKGFDIVFCLACGTSQII